MSEFQKYHIKRGTTELIIYSIPNATKEQLQAIGDHLFLNVIRRDEINEQKKKDNNHRENVRLLDKRFKPASAPRAKRNQIDIFGIEGGLDDE